MNPFSDYSILVATDNKSTAEVITKQLADEFDNLLIPDSEEELIALHRRHWSEVILLAYDDLATCQRVYGQLERDDAGRPPDQKMHRVIALCNKQEVQEAYRLCRAHRFNDYIVFWPLTYDPFRLAMSVHQQMSDLRHNHNAREHNQSLVQQQETLDGLQQFAGEQSDRSRQYGRQIESEATRLLATMCETLKRYDHVVDHVLEQRETQGTLDAPARAFRVIRNEIHDSMGGFDDLRQSSREFISRLDESRERARPLLREPRNNRGHLLVVDDDEFQRKVLKSILEPLHYTMDFAANGDEALKQLHKRRPDLILMDILMPQLDGIAATYLIRTDPEWGDIPIVIISGQNQRHTVVECVNKGASDYIVKPYNRQTLIAKIEAQLTSRHNSA